MPVSPVPPTSALSASPVATQPPAEPVQPPRHPIAPSTAPAGWDERAGRPAGTGGIDDELWSALADDGSAAAAAPTAAGPSNLTATASDRFGAFAADTVDPFEALTVRLRRPLRGRRPTKRR